MNKKYRNYFKVWTNLAMKSWFKDLTASQKGVIYTILERLKIEGDDGYYDFGSYTALRQLAHATHASTTQAVQEGVTHKLWVVQDESVIHSLQYVDEQELTAKELNAKYGLNNGKNNPIPDQTITDQTTKKRKKGKSEKVLKIERENREFATEVASAWNDIFSDHSLPLLQFPAELSNQRVKLVTARANDIDKYFPESDDTLDGFYVFFLKVKSMPHLMGQTNSNWKANLDWVLKPNNFIKICEGHYNTKQERTYDETPPY